MANTKKNMLTVCCLGYNHGIFAKDFLDSFKHVKTEIEIIILDDGSPDNSIEIIRKLVASYNYNVRVISQNNTGNIGLNHNKMLRLAKGEFVTFISLDDCLYDDSIDQSIELLKADPNLAFVASSKITPIDQNKKILDNVNLSLKLESISNPSVKDLLELEYSDFNSFYLQGTFFRKEIVDCVNGFDEDLIGDDIVLRTKVFLYLLDHPEYSFKIVNYPLCYYRFHDSNIHKNFSRQIRIVTEYLGRYWADREIPKILEGWYLYTTRNMSFKDTISLALINDKASELLKSDHVISKLEKRIVSKHSFIRYIFCKKKEGEKRTITFFSCISFSYYKR